MIALADVEDWGSWQKWETFSFCIWQVCYGKHNFTGAKRFAESMQHIHCSLRNRFDTSLVCGFLALTLDLFKSNLQRGYTRALNQSVAWYLTMLEGPWNCPQFPVPAKLLCNQQVSIRIIEADQAAWSKILLSDIGGFCYCSLLACSVYPRGDRWRDTCWEPGGGSFAGFTARRCAYLRFLRIGVWVLSGILDAPVRFPQSRIWPLSEMHLECPRTYLFLFLEINRHHFVMHRRQIARTSCFSTV